MIDNYDSFTYNLVQYLGELGADVVVRRNDEITIQEIEDDPPDKIVISPGPCTPNEAGISMDVVRSFGCSVPILGVCLGHQSIGQVYGGNVVRAKKVMHGKISTVYHTGRGVFRSLPPTLSATRYHSLVVDMDTLPDCLEITAFTMNADGRMDEVMGFRHREFPVEGVQFHPESIKTDNGHDLLRNFLNGCQ